MMKSCDQISLQLGYPNDLITVTIDVWDHSLAHKWLNSLNHLIKNQYHLEKNYCFFGFADGPRDGKLLCNLINDSIAEINAANLGYAINDTFILDQILGPEWQIDHDKFNCLHRYFEDLQGVSGRLSRYYQSANSTTRWHIRQLNLLCHEFESWALSLRKKHTAPEWQRPSQLMCWLRAPRFDLDASDYEYFGIETLNRPLGGVFVGVNKAVGKHHWEVFQDEGRDSRIGELTTSSMRSQTEAAGDFDIEWANNPGNFSWQIENIKAFREWLQKNGFDPEDRSLTIGHPQVGQVNLQSSFGTEDYQQIWKQLSSHMNVWSISTSQARAVYDYDWSDPDYQQRQIDILDKY